VEAIGDRRAKHESAALDADTVSIFACRWGSVIASMAIRNPSGSCSSVVMS
jgi:hypothetical protein